MRKLPFVLVVVCLLLVLSNALVIAQPHPSAVVHAHVEASTVTIADTTATWDAGTKASTSTTTDACENVTANHLRLNNSGAFQGIGLTTNSTGCPTGAWAVSQSGLLVSYDWQTLRSGKLMDFAGTNDGTLKFTNATNAVYGGGRSLNNADYAFTSSKISVGASWSVFAYLNYTGEGSTGVQGYSGIVDEINGTSTRILIQKLVPATSVLVQIQSGIARGIVFNGLPDLLNAFHAIVFVYDRVGNTSKLFVDGTQYGGTQTAFWKLDSGPQLSHFGWGGNTGIGYYLKGVFDEAQVYNRALTPSEIASLSVDGRAQFRSTGSWVSPTQSTPGLIPSMITVQASGVTAARQLAYVAVLNATGGVIWNGTGYNAGGSNWYTFRVPHLSEALKGWGVKAGLIGDGTGTADLLSLSVFVVPPIPAGGGGPAWSLACAFNALLVSWTCSDYTNYTGYVVFGVAWSYDGTPVAESQPNERVTFRAPGQSWASNDADHTLNLTASTATGTWSYELPLRSTERAAWLIALALVVLVIGAALSFGHQATNRGVYFPPVANPSYRRSAVSVEEYPKGWRSYRQRDPDKYTRLRSVRRGNLWIVYGIRPSTPAEQERTGRKYIAEVQTVREKM